MRPVAFVGLISYSLYLWHWPIIAFLEQNYILSSGSSSQLKLSVVKVSMIAGTLSWRFVETPFRTGRFRPGRRALFRVTGAAAALVAIFGVFTLASEGFPSRFPSGALALARYTDFDFAQAVRKNVCFIGPFATSGTTFADFNKAACLAEDPTRKHYLLIGDSVAAHLYPGLLAVFTELNVSQATSAGCKALLTDPKNRRDYCVGMQKYIFGDYLPRHHVDAILISGLWAEADFPELGRTIVWLQQRGIETILFGPVTEFNVPLPRLLMLSLRDRNVAMIDRYRSIVAWQTDQKLSEIARNQWKIRYISTYENLCASPQTRAAQDSLPTTSNCPVYAAPGVPLFYDDHHFTPDGSILFAKTMRKREQLP